MAEPIEKLPNKDEVLGFKVSKDKAEEIRQFCFDRDWKLSAFIRVAIEESMEKVKSEGK